MLVPRIVIAIVAFAALHLQASDAWLTSLARQVNDTRVGMTFEDVTKTIPQAPFVRRVYQRGTTQVVEWSYPTDEKRWTTLVFENGRVTGRQDKTAPAFPREVVKRTDNDSRTREKLRTVGVGTEVGKVDALDLTPSSTVSSAQWRQMMASPEMDTLLSDADSIARTLGGTESLALAFTELDPSSFDELRSFELSGESVSITIKDGTIKEIVVFANPDPEWAMRKLAVALSSRKRVAADFEKIKPGTSLVEVIMSLGIPSSEEKRTTVEGTEIVMLYNLSRRQRFEILVRDDKVVSITSRSRY